MKYLGFWVTHDGIKSIYKNMKPTISQEEVRQFIGVVNYYRGMCKRRSRMLAPLTKITSSNVKFKWTKIEQDTFGEIKRVVACNTLLTYPYFNE